MWCHRLWGFPLLQPGPINWNVKRSLGASVSIKNRRNALKVWVTRFCCANTQPAGRESQGINRRSRSSEVLQQGGWIGFLFLGESSANLWSRTFLKNRLAPLCNEWLERDLGFSFLFFLFFFNPVDLVQEQNSSVKSLVKGADGLTGADINIDAHRFWISEAVSFCEVPKSKVPAVSVHTQHF